MKQLFRQWYDLSEIKKELTTRNWFPKNEWKYFYKSQS